MAGRAEAPVTRAAARDRPCLGGFGPVARRVVEATVPRGVVIPAGVQFFVALEAIDLRYGFARLSGMVREQIGYEPDSGALFVF